MSIIVTILTVCVIAKFECAKFSSLDNTYHKGVQAYRKERWSECIVQFEDALHIYKLYNSILINCRLKCKTQNRGSLFNTNIEDLNILEFFFTTRDCLTKCKDDEFEKVRLYQNASDTVLVNMYLKKPYEYLHICYFQMNALPKAASAAYTYLVAHPDDETMKINFNYYTDQPEVDINEVEDFEIQNYQRHYQVGLKTYKLKKWQETVTNMEETLKDYLAWENSCRAECESQPEQEWDSEVTISVAYNMASLLTCRQNCQIKLKPFHNSGVEFLADVLNYLQISYYHLNKLEDAVKSVTTYLLLLPKDEDMLKNRDFYKSLIGENKFVERSDIIYYFKRDLFEKKLLKYFHKEDDYMDNLV